MHETVNFFFLDVVGAARLHDFFKWHFVAKKVYLLSPIMFSAKETKFLLATFFRIAVITNYFFFNISLSWYLLSVVYISLLFHRCLNCWKTHQTKFIQEDISSNLVPKDQSWGKHEGHFLRYCSLSVVHQ